MHFKKDESKRRHRHAGPIVMPSQLVSQERIARIHALQNQLRWIRQDLEKEVRSIFNDLEAGMGCAPGPHNAEIEEIREGLSFRTVLVVDGHPVV